MRNTDVSVTFRRYIIKVLFSVNIYVVWISVSTSEALNTQDLCYNSSRNLIILSKLFSTHSAQSGI